MDEQTFFYKHKHPPLNYEMLNNGQQVVSKLSLIRDMGDLSSPIRSWVETNTILQEKSFEKRSWKVHLNSFRISKHGELESSTKSQIKDISN